MTPSRPCARIVQFALLLIVPAASSSHAAVSDAERAAINAAARPGSARLSPADARAQGALRATESAKRTREVEQLRNGLARAEARGDAQSAAAFRAALEALHESAWVAASVPATITPTADGVNVMPYVPTGW